MHHCKTKLNDVSPGSYISHCATTDILVQHNSSFTGQSTSDSLYFTWQYKWIRFSSGVFLWFIKKETFCLKCLLHVFFSQFHFIIILAHFTRNHLVKLFPPFFYRQPHLTGQLIADAMQQSVYFPLHWQFNS